MARKRGFDMNYEVLSCDGDFNAQFIKKVIVDRYNIANIPCEWFLMNAIFHYNMYFDASLADILMKFVSIYYPDFVWMYKNLGDSQKIVDNEIFFNGNYYYSMASYDVEDSVELNDFERKMRERAMYFGSIIRDFAVRYLGYSIINHEDKTVLTSNTEDERISVLMESGYQVNRSERLECVREEKRRSVDYDFVVTTIPFAMMPKSSLCL